MISDLSRPEFTSRSHHAAEDSGGAKPPLRSFSDSGYYACHATIRVEEISPGVEVHGRESMKRTFLNVDSDPAPSHSTLDLRSC